MNFVRSFWCVDWVRDSYDVAAELVDEVLLFLFLSGDVVFLGHSDPTECVVDLVGTVLGVFVHLLDFLDLQGQRLDEFAQQHAGAFQLGLGYALLFAAGLLFEQAFDGLLVFLQHPGVRQQHVVLVFQHVLRLRLVWVSPHHYPPPSF